MALVDTTQDVAMQATYQARCSVNHWKENFAFILQTVFLHVV